MLKNRAVAIILIIFFCGLVLCGCKDDKDDYESYYGTYYLESGVIYVSGSGRISINPISEINNQPQDDNILYFLEVIQQAGHSFSLDKNDIKFNAEVPKSFKYNKNYSHYFSFNFEWQDVFPFVSVQITNWGTKYTPNYSFDFEAIKTINGENCLVSLRYTDRGD